MKYLLSLFILLTVSVHAFSQIRIHLSTHPDTLPHVGSYYIASITDNRHTGRKERTIGRLHGVVGSQDIRLNESAADRVHKFYNAVHPKRPTDTSAIIISLDSFWCTNKVSFANVPVITSLTLRFIRQSTGQVLYTANSRQEEKTNWFTQPIFRKQIETGLLTALTNFEESALLP